MKIGIEEIKKLKERSGNPNIMSKEQIESLKKSISKFGELQPILIDQDNIIIDGHQRVEAYKQLNKTQIPVIRLNLKKDADKKLLSQIMNHVKGKDDPLLEAVEFKEILKEIDMEEFSSLTSISEQEILNIIEASEKETEEKSKDIGQVEQLGKMLCTCPKCGHEFEKKD